MSNLMAMSPRIDATLEEHMKAAGAKDAQGTAASLRDGEIDSFQDLLDIDPKVLMQVMKECGIKPGSAGKIHAYRTLFSRRIQRVRFNREDEASTHAARMRFSKHRST